VKLEEWREFFVMAASGEPVEKWRLVEQFPPERYVRYERSWTSPFSNSPSSDTPVIPLGGRLSFADNFERKTRELWVKSTVVDGALRVTGGRSRVVRAVRKLLP
jgi:hypothetical protein